jgi:hypothetical protein
MSQLRVNSIGNLSGTKIDSTDDIVDVGLRNDTAYAQFNKIGGQSFTTGAQVISLDENAISKNISLNTSNSIITFSIPGVYQVNVGFRFGTATDAWTGVNLATTSSVVVGTSFGTGNVSNDPGPAMFNFLANITDISAGYYLRVFRAAGTMAVATPDVNAGRAFVATFLRVS